MDLNLDPLDQSAGVPRRIPLTPEDSAAIGALAKIQVGNPRDKREVLEQIVQFMESEHVRALTDPDPFVAVRAVARARRTLAILTRAAGYPYFSDCVTQLDVALDEAARLVRRELIRRLLLDTVSEIEAEECFRVLNATDADVLDADFAAVEAALCA